MSYNKETPEQIHKLKDGRIIYKTHNGFKYWTITKKGEVIPTTEQYYKQCLKHSIKQLKKLP